MRKVYGDLVPESEKKEFSLDDWKIDQYVDEPEPLEYLIRPTLPVETVALLASMGGVGKSYMLLDICVRLAAGVGMGNYVFGGKVERQCRSVLITAEDSQRAIARRLHQIISPDEFPNLGDRMRLVPLSDAGGAKHFLVASGGNYRMTVEFEEMCNELIKFEPEFIGIDPLQAVAGVDINDAAAAQTWWNAISQLSTELKATILTTHHMRKSEHEIDGPMAARLAVKGSTTLIDGSRHTICLWPAPTAQRLEAEDALGEPLGTMDMICQAVVKSNELGMSSDTTIYIRDKESGLLIDSTRDLSTEIEEKNTLGYTQLEELLTEVQARWDRGDPFSFAVQSDRWVGAWMIGRFDVKKPVAQRYLKDWREKGYFIQEYVPKLKSKGIRRGGMNHR